jgi:hypothetical protein
MLFVISVSAESGSIVISDDKSYSYSTNSGCGVMSGANYSMIKVDNTDFNYLSSFHIHPASTSFANQFESSSFTFVSGATGSGGVVSYDANQSAVYYVFTSDMVITSNLIIIQLNNNIFQNISSTAGMYNVNQPTLTQPVGIHLHNTNCGVGDGQVAGNYDSVNVALRAMDYYSVTYPFNGFFSVNITKNSYVPSKYFILGSSSIYSQETTFNKVNISGALFNINDGIILNATLSSGIFTRVIVNSTNCPNCLGGGIPQLPQYPATGANIYFDKSSYVIGDNVGITYYVANSTWSSYIFSCEMEFYENDIRKKSVVLSSGADYLEYTPAAGTLKTNIVCGLSRKIEGTASVSVFPVSQSYIYLLNGTTAKAGAVSNFSYRWGFTPSTYRWINIYKYDSNQNTWIKESSNSVQTGSLANTLYTTSIIIKSAGKYAAELCDLNKQCPAAKIIFDSVYLPNTPISNYSVSNITIINPQASYAQNDWLRFSTRVDATNFTTKSVSVRLYNTGTTTAQTLQYISNEAETNQVYLSSPMESGLLSLQLVGANGSGIFVLAETPLTISIIDAGGYALTADRYRVCKNEVVAVSAISPGSATVTFSTVPIQRFNFSGSKTWSIKIAQDVTVSLDVNGEQKKMIPIYVNASCGGTVTPPDTPGTGPEATTKFLSSGMLVVLIVMMIFAGAGQVIGGFSGAVIGFGSGFIFLSVFGYVPVWALFLFAIIAITAFAVMGGKSLVGGGDG